MNNKKWNYSKIIKEIKKNGYFVFKNYLDKKDIKEIKESLLETFNYIKKGKEKNLQKKYYEIKKFSPKLKGNWYDISNYNMTLNDTYSKQMEFNRTIKQETEEEGALKKT